METIKYHGTEFEVVNIDSDGRGELYHSILAARKSRHLVELLSIRFINYQSTPPVIKYNHVILTNGDAAKLFHQSA